MPHIILFVFALAICLVIPVSMSAPTQPVERQVSSVPSFVLQYGKLYHQHPLLEVDPD